MEIPEYFVYCGIFIMRSWGKRSVQIAKGQFLEVAKNKSGSGFAAGHLPDCLSWQAKTVRDGGAIFGGGRPRAMLAPDKSPGIRQNFKILIEKEFCDFLLPLHKNLP